jgi:transmembrane sensor
MSNHDKPGKEPERADIVRQAAAWLARIHQGQLNSSEEAALQRWRRQSPQHELVWQQAGQLSSKLGAVPGRIGMSVLDRPALLNRREFLKPLAILMVAVPSGLLSYRYLPWQNWTADYKTDVGNMETYRLADKGSLMLNTGTAVDVDYSASERLIHLYTGEIYVETAHDPAKRPFSVITPYGRLVALGTRFVVRLDQGACYLGVLEGAVEIRTVEEGAMHMAVKAGQQSTFTASWIDAITELDPNATAWVDGILYADNMPLPDFLALLNRYRSGILRCDESATGVRISGAFLLKDPDHILETIQNTRPLRIEWRTRYWGTFYKT